MSRIFLFVITVLSLSSIAVADDGGRPTLLDLPANSDFLPEVHGFFGQGYMQTTGNNYLPNSNDGTTAFSEAGVNFSKQITPNLHAGLQLFTEDFGSTGNYQVNFDWYNLDYRWRDWLGIRAGKTKIPYGLYNESRDIDAARAPVFLPQSVYPESQRDYLLAQTGVDIYGYADLSMLGSIEYQIYRGTLQIGLDEITTVPLFQVTSETAPYVDGGRVIWNTPLSGLRVAGSYQDLEVDTNFWVSALSQAIALRQDVTMVVGSIEYATRNFQLAAEYTKWWEQVNSNNPALIAPTNVDQERYYGMASFRVKEWLHPGVFYSLTHPNISQESQIGNYTKDWAAYCRVDLTNNWLFKLEWHYIDGTSQLTSTYNNNLPLNNMEPYWQLLMAKTTFYF